MLSRNMMNVIIKKIQPFIWFSLNTVLKWEKVNVISRWFFTSDNKEFYTYINQIENIFELNGNLISNFLIIIKKDWTSHINFIDNKWLSIKCHFIKDKKKWEKVYKSDVLWISSIDLSSYNIEETDWLIFCFKLNWKFWLYFDLTNFVPNSNYRLDIEWLYKTLWANYNLLFYQQELDFINNNEVYKQILNDWWYPFISILSDYREVYNFYLSWKINNDIFDKIINKFDKWRLEEIQNKWFNNNIFSAKQSFLKAWIEAYLQNTESWYINCLNTLGLQIEWLLHEYYLWETWNANNYKQIIEYLKNKISNSWKSNLLTIWFNDSFVNFLLEHVFWKFDIKTWKLDFSRNTIWHWVAKASDFNKYRAFQYILIIDQLYYYFIHK